VVITPTYGGMLAREEDKGGNDISMQWFWLEVQTFYIGPLG